MNKHEQIPKWVLDANGFKTQRQFKEMFRRKARILDKAIWEILSWSAYIPKDSWLTILDMRTDIDNIKEQLSQKEWGR